MKKYFIAFLLIILMIGIMTGTILAEDSLAEIKEKGKIVVGLDDSFPPMGFRDEAGEIVGFDIDLAKEAARRMGVEVEFKPVQWDGVLLSLKNGMIDLIWNGLTITEKRAEQIDFSDPYLANRQIIIVQSDADLVGKADLSGKVVAAQLGSSSVTAIESEPEIMASFAELRLFSNNTEALLDLQTGRVDAVVVDEIVGRYYISKRPGVFKVLKADFGREEYGVGIRQNETSFKAELNRVMQEMKTDGTGAEISKKWFGEDILLK